MDVDAHIWGINVYIYSGIIIVMITIYFCKLFMHKRRSNVNCRASLFQHHRHGQRPAATPPICLITAFCLFSNNGLAFFKKTLCVCIYNSSSPPADALTDFTSKVIWTYIWKQQGLVIISQISHSKMDKDFSFFLSTLAGRSPLKMMVQMGEGKKKEQVIIKGEWKAKTAPACVHRRCSPTHPSMQLHTTDSTAEARGMVMEIRLIVD